MPISQINTNSIANGAVVAADLAAGSVVLTGSAVSGVLPQTNGGTGTTIGYNGFKNRIINGAMMIDQRNAGASVTISSVAQIFGVDRFSIYGSQTNKLSMQQNAGSVTPPVGFTNYLGITSLSSYAVTGNDVFQFYQVIEGNNIADLGWGTANAQPATLSFWVRSSLTGTFGGSIATSGSGVWVLPFSYVISLANTWTYITVSIPASTSALTNNNNTAGVFVRFGLGSSGTSAGGTSGTWTNAGNFIQPAGTTSVVGTNGATFYITGVQLEKGSTATNYDVRSYGTELQLCQRYYGENSQAYFPSNVSMQHYFKASMRTAPTVTWAGSGGVISGISTEAFAGYSTSNGTAKFTASAEL